MDARWRACPACGAVNEESICLGCGRSLIGVEATDKPPRARKPRQPRAPRQPRELRRVFPALLAVLVVAAAILAVRFFLLGTQPDTVTPPVPETHPEPDTYVAELKWAAQTVLGLSMGSAEMQRNLKVVKDQYSYYITNGQALYFAYYGHGRNVKIPSEIEGCPVTAIMSNAFQRSVTVHSITIPESVNYIGSLAFSGCSALEMMVIPDSVKFIGSQAFYNCTQLTSLSIPDSVAYIGYGAFSDTPWFEALTDEFCVAGDGVLIKYNGVEANAVIPDGVTVIAGGVFQEREELDSVVIPDSVSVIGQGAFYECDWLAEVTIPYSVVEIEAWAFEGSEWLERQTDDFIIVNDMLIRCNSEDVDIVVPRVGKICELAFYDRTQLESVRLKNGVTEIGGMAFYGCESLRRVTIPGSVRRIADYVFAECGSITAVYFEGDAPDVGVHTFRDWSYRQLMLIIYRKKDASGWGDKWQGYYTATWTDNTAVEISDNIWYDNSIDPSGADSIKGR